MNAPSTELLELCGAVRDETATPDQITRLEFILAHDPEARRFYRQFTHISAMLERYEQLPPPSAEIWSRNIVLESDRNATAAPRVPARWRMGLRSWLALAACLALLAAVYLRLKPAPIDVAPENPAAAKPEALAFVQDSHHCTVIPRAGPAVALNETYQLEDGDIVATGANGNAVLRFAEENTLFILSPDTRAWLSREGATKIVHLTSGQIYGDVAPQTDGAQWRIITADGEARVLGTQLAVSALTNSTRVAVTSGLVRVTSRDSRKSIETPAGFAAELTPTTARLVKLDATQPTRVASFTLIDADTNQPIAGFTRLKDGDVIDLAALPTRRLNIQANCEPKLVGAVRFVLTAADASGAVMELRQPPEAVDWRGGFPNTIELYYPYMVAGDPSFEGQPLPTHSHPWTPPIGRYSIRATPYAAMKAWGARGEALNVEFEVIDRAAGK